MRRLIANDFRLNAVLFSWLFVISNLYYLLLARIHMLGRGYAQGGVAVGIAFTSLMVLALFLREDQNKGQIIYRSLPLSHAKIVSARYISVFLIAMANVAYGVSIQLINLRLGPWVMRYGGRVVRDVSIQMDAGYALEHSLIARALALTVVISVAVPLIIRYGSLWRILIGYLVLMFVWSIGVSRLLRLSLYTGFFLGLSRWMFFAIVSMCIMLSISYKLSVWLYGRREL
ncbi:MAG: ABC-2 transporter permease [Bacteroidota bacterium]